MNIKLNNISKVFKGIAVIDKLNLSIDSGKIYGFIGHNGSGKTMLLRIISGLIIPTSGKVFIDSDELHKNISFPSDMGLIIEQPEFLNYASGYKNLMYLAKIKNKIDSNKVKETMKLLGLNPENKNSVKTYSLGMKQRLAIAQALMEDPKLIILDEPFNGLDESGVQFVRELLLKLKSEDKVIILTSHNKEDIDLLCDEVYKLQEGKISNLV